jgi:hypothetical protein
MEQSHSCETNRFSASEEISPFYGTRKFITAFTRAHFLSHFWSKSVQSMPPSYFLKVHFNIILPATPGSSKRSLSLRFPHQNPVCSFPLPPMCYMPRISCFPIWSLEWYLVRSQFIHLPLCSFLHYPDNSLFHLDPNILLRTIFWNILSLRSSFDVSDQVSHPYKTKGKIIVLYVLTFIFVDNKLEDKRFCTEW